MNAGKLQLALLLALAQAAQAAFTPIPITPGSFTGDAVIEKTAPQPVGVAVNATIDNGISIQNGTGTTFGDTWNEIGFFTANPTHGIPLAGSTFTAISNSAISFVMAPSYAANNAILIDGTVTNGTWIPAAPAAYSSLSFLSSGGNSGRMINVTARHQDGTTSTGSFSSPDWFNVTSGVAWIANGRINAANHAEDNANSNNPRFYYRNVAIANTTSPITNITLTLGTGGGTGHVGVMAVSGSTDGTTYTPIVVTGYTVDVVVEASAAQPVALSTATTLTMDGGTNNNGSTWYEAGYQPFFPTSGLPTAGSTVSSLALPDHSYQMPASYAANNAIYVDSNNPVANITFTTPAAYSALSFLSATANGNVTNSCTIQYADGSSETQNFISRDWFNNTPFAYNANGRLNTDNRSFQAVNQQNPRLYEAQFALANTVSPVTNIVMTWIGAPDINGRAFIFAISGSTGPVPPIIGSSPQSLQIYQGTSFNLSATVTGGNAPFTYRWQKGTNGVYADLADGGRWTGTDTLTLTNAAALLADNADYRVRVANGAGSVNSGVATVAVLTTNLTVLTPGDPVTPVVNNFPGGEPPANSFDGTTTKYLNFGLNSGSTTPVGFVVTPSKGSTFVTGIRLFTANDATERDPANSILEGSNNGGSSWSLIWSNSFTLPDARNAGGLAIDPMTQAMIERNFVNTNAYTMYRWTVSQLKNRPGANAMQIGEVQLLGVTNSSPQPVFIVQPTSITVFNDGFSSAYFAAIATGSPDPTYQWRKGTNGVYVNVVDGGHVSGALTSFLSVSPADYSDAADYICVASNTAGPAYSAVARLTVISPLPDVTQPGDPVTVFGDEASGFWGAAGTGATSIDGTTSAYRNGGSGPSAAAGFPPFAGPVGLVVTPSQGSTLVTGLRIYTSDASSANDPAIYKLEGSNNGGASYTLLATGSLTLPDTRNPAAAGLDPLSQAMSEVLFANTQAFKSYRLTVTQVKDNDSANSMALGDIELLGVVLPDLTITIGTGGSLTITTSQPGTLWSATELKAAGTAWNNEGPITGSATITPIPSEPHKFYRVSVP